MSGHLAFTAPLARAVARGLKTQTRRPHDPMRHVKPPHPIGARLWLREPARCLGYPTSDMMRLQYVSDGAEAVVPYPDRLRPVPIGHGLPNGCHREAARVFVRVTGYRIERLQAITGADILAEGMGQPWNGLGIEMAGGMTPDHEAQLRQKWAALWDAIYPDRPWRSDPWVGVITFEVVP